MARKKKTEAVEKIEEGLGSVELHTQGGWPESDVAAKAPRAPRRPTVSFEERQAIRIAHHEAMAKKQRKELEQRAQAKLKAQVEKALKISGEMSYLFARLMGLPSEALEEAAQGAMALPVPKGQARHVYILALLRAQIDWIEGRDVPSVPYEEELQAPEPEPMRDVLIGG